MRVDVLDCPATLRLRTDRRVVHLKGFGASLPTGSPPPRLLALLRSADVIVFDGDDFGASSFTRLIINSEIAPALAFKLAAELPKFVHSWSAAPPGECAVRVCGVNPSACADARFVDAAAARAWRADARGSGAAAAPPELDDSGLRPEQQRFVALGVFAVETTRRVARDVSVAAWGGGAVLANEFRQHDALWGEAMPPWVYFHAERFLEGGELQAGRLLGVGHPRLSVVAGGED